MAIKLIEVGTSAGVGALDIITEEVDKKQGYLKPFQNVTDLSRAVVTIGGYAANYSEMGDAEVSKAAVLSGLPLLEKSIYKAIRRWVPGLGRKGRRLGLKLLKKGQQGQQLPQTGSQIRYV